MMGGNVENNSFIINLLKSFKIQRMNKLKISEIMCEVGDMWVLFKNEILLSKSYKKIHILGGKRMYSHDKREDGQCCIAAHKKKIVICLAAMVLIKMVVIGLVCTHKCHHQDYCKKEVKNEE